MKIIGAMFSGAVHVPGTKLNNDFTLHPSKQGDYRASMSDRGLLVVLAKGNGGVASVLIPYSNIKYIEFEGEPSVGSAGSSS